MNKCNKNIEIYDPSTKKCFLINSEKGRYIQSLVNLCYDNPLISSKCKYINDFYHSHFKRFKHFLKKLVIPILSILLFNIFIVLVLSNSKIRSKIVSYIIKNLTNLASSNPYFTFIDPLINYIPVLKNFINNFQNLTLYSINYINPTDIYNTLYNSFVYYTDIGQPQEQDVIHNLANDFHIIMPGALPTQAEIDLKNIQVSNLIDDRINNINEAKNMVNNIFSNVFFYFLV